MKPRPLPRPARGTPPPKVTLTPFDPMTLPPTNRNAQEPAMPMPKKKSHSFYAGTLRAEIHKVASGDYLRTLLSEYEATGDHDHGDGRGPHLPGSPCPGGDCIVAQARNSLRLLDPTFVGTGAEFFLDGWRRCRQNDASVFRGLGGDRLRGYIEAALHRANGLALDDDTAMRAWTRA